MDANRFGRVHRLQCPSVLEGNSCLNTAPADIGQGSRKISNTFACNALSVNKRRWRHKPSSSRMTAAWLQEPQHQLQLWKSILSSMQWVTEEFAKTATLLAGEILTSLRDGESPVARRMPTFPAALPWALQRADTMPHRDWLDSGRLAAALPLTGHLHPRQILQHHGVACVFPRGTACMDQQSP